MKLSIISTMYQSSPYLREFCERALRTATQYTDDYELILVNDGSPDDSLAIALELQQNNHKISIVDLSRNFGHHVAIRAGIEHSTGDEVFILDCDLEEQPEWLLLFKREMDRLQVDVVYGVQEKRVASAFSNFFGSLFWRALNFMSTITIPHNPMTCRLMKRAYVNALLSINDRVLFLAGTFAWAGFRQHALSLVKTPRPAHHRSSYSISRKMLQIADSLSSFSTGPLTFIFITGCLIWTASVIYGLFLAIQKFFEPETILSGFTSMMLSIWFLSGVIIMALGIIGLYIAKIFQEVKRRPLFITRTIYKGNEHE